LDIATTMIAMMTASEVASITIITLLESLMSRKAIHHDRATTAVVARAPRSAESGIPAYSVRRRQA